MTKPASRASQRSVERQKDIVVSCSNVNVRATAGLAGTGRPAYSVSMGVVSAVEWMPVESGLFSSAAYRASERQLYLRFHDGKIYRFFDCPVTVYTEFIAATSKGRFSRSKFGITSAMRWCAAAVPANAIVRARSRAWRNN